MTITATQYNANASEAPRIARGAYLDDAGSPAVPSIDVGFAPKYVKVVNATDGDPIYEWFVGMTSAHAIKMADHDTAQFTVITSAGIVVSGNTFGFTPVQNKQYYWVCEG